MIIGIAGESEHGKDTVGELIDELWAAKNYKGSKSSGRLNATYYDEFRMIKFADGINRVISALTGYPIEYVMNKDNYNIPILWLGGRTIRQLKQQIGEGMKPILGEDIWVKTSFAKVPSYANIKVTDVRNPVEQDFLYERKAILIFVERPGHKSLSLESGDKNHQSEIDVRRLDKSKFHPLINDSTRLVLKERLKAILETYEAWNNPTSLTEN